jgi:hypothetical protein
MDYRGVHRSGLVCGGLLAVTLLPGVRWGGRRTSGRTPARTRRSTAPAVAEQRARRQVARGRNDVGTGAVGGGAGDSVTLRGCRDADAEADVDGSDAGGDAVLVARRATAADDKPTAS